MNNSIYDIVAKNVKQIFDEENISVIVTYETKLDRTSGIDSLNLLKLTLRIEEDLGINLDDYLNLIHSAGTVSELVSVIEKAIEDYTSERKRIWHQNGNMPRFRHRNV